MACRVAECDRTCCALAGDVQPPAEHAVRHGAPVPGPGGRGGSVIDGLMGYTYQFTASDALRCETCEVCIV